MSSSGWVRNTAAKLVAPLLVFVLGGLIVGALTTLGLQEELASRRDSKARAEQYAATKQKPEYNACARLPLFHQKDCLAEAGEASRANQRSERDLVAQETTAAWTFITSIAALIGVVLSFFGVGLVWGTFRETRKTNEITREIGQAQVRAYLSLEIENIELKQSVTNGERAIRAKFTCRVENKGQSPARNPRVLYDVSTVRDGEMVTMMDDGSDTHNPGQPIQSVASGGHTMTTLSRTFVSEAPDVLESDHRVRFRYIIEYIDVFNEKRRDGMISGTIHRSKPGSDVIVFMADYISPAPPSS